MAVTSVWGRRIGRGRKPESQEEMEMVRYPRASYLSRGCLYL